MANNLHPVHQLENHDADNSAEIALIDILLFLKSTYKTILLFGVMGGVVAISYLAITPKQYEATAQIAMAQIGAANNNKNNNLNLLGVNIEEPPLLIARLSQPTSFPAPVINSCGLEGNKEAAFALSKGIKLTLPKGVANIVELKTFGPSPQAAQSCGEAIVGLITATQGQLVAPYIKEANIKLLDDEERLAKAKEWVAKADKSGSAMSAAYLSTRDEIRFLLDEITTLKNIVISNQGRATRLIAPIYASDEPVAPKKRAVLAAGLFGSFFLGLLLAVGRQTWVKLKSEMQEQKQGVV